MFLAYVTVCILSSFASIQAIGSDRHLVCRDVRFDSEGGSFPFRSQVLHHPRTGKAGPVGPPGREGRKGEPGTIDYSSLRVAISEEVNVKVEEKFSQIFSMLEQFNSTLLEMQVRPVRPVERKEKPSKNASICQTTHLGKCYWMIRSSRRVNYDDARSLCAEEGGDPADVPDENHWSRISSMLRRSRVSKIWTGMTINEKNITDGVILFDGTKSDFTKWIHSGYPAPFLVRSRIALWRSHGMTNEYPSSSLNGILCQS